MPLTRNVDLRNLNRVKRTTTNLDPITYNDRYPGLDEYNYNKLSSKIDMLGLSGYDREKAMDEAYTQVLPLVQNDIKNSDRRKYINQSKYEVSQIQDPTQQKQANMKLSVVELTQLVKEKYNVDPSANDEAVFNSWMETIPNGEQLLVKYLNNGDKELLYKGGLEERPQKQLDGNFWSNAWANMKSEARGPLDALEKFTYKGIKNIQNLGLKLDDYLAGIAPQSWKDDVMGDMSLEEYRARNKDYRETNKQEIGNYIDLVNTETSNYRDRNVNTQIDDYYDSKNYTDLLREGDWNGFFYKGLGDGASNRDMPVIIGASIVNPAMGTALMGTTSYVRESEEAYENMRRAGATHEEAEVGGAVVGMINAAIEVYLDKLLGGVETSSSKAIRNSLKGNVSQIIGRQSIPNILAHATGVYTRSSLEEGLEEWLQNIVSNAAEMTVKENPEWKDLFKGGRAAAEGGIFNPLNILAPGGDIIQNTDINAVKQTLNEDAYNAGQTTRNIIDKSNSVWQKAVDTATRSIPEKVVENELKLTPTERKNVEKYGVTPANFVLNEKIAGLSNGDKVVALQDISSDAYNNITNIFKNVIPQDYRTESKTAGKMLQTMIETMEKSDIVKEEYADYIAKLKEMKDNQTFSPYEKLAIRRDFDAIVGNDIFGANGRVKGLEDQTIAKWRADLNEEINQLGEEFGIDVKSENSRIANAITIRDGLLRALSQNKKNNAIGLQDLGIGAILSAGNPVQAGGIIIAKRLLENAAGNIAQGIYNLNNAPLERANTKRGAGFIQKSNPNANNNFMISSASSDNSINTQEELVTEDIDVGTNPLDTIPDRNVGGNPTDTVISENVNKTALNQAQNLYNQGDENLSPNSEQMTEVRSYTAEELGLPPVSATMLKNLDRSKYIPVEDPKTKKVVFYKVEELEQIPIYDSKGNKLNFDRTYTSKELGLDKDDKTSAYFEAIANSNRHDIEKDINNLQIGQEIRFENQNGYGYGGRILKGKNGMVVEYDGVDGLDKIKQADIKEWIDNHKILGYIVIDDTNNNETYADESYRPSITMKIDMNKEIIKTIKDMDIWDKLGFVDKFNRKGVLERTNEGYEYHFLNDPEEGSSPFPTVLDDIDIIGFTEPYYGAADPDYSDILSPKETKQEKSTTKNASIDELIDEVWHDIGDEGDWDWYKKMKKKDVIDELEDYVMDRMGEAEKSYGANYGIGWSEVQKKIKKFVNNKFSNEKKI